MNEKNTIEAEPEANTESPVLVLPGHLFFVDRIELPTTLEDGEIDDFAELNLEGLAPFPIEQLYWGFIHNESTGSILLYAAYKERVKAAGYNDIDSYLWVLPDFATTAGAYFPEATTLMVESAECISQIVLKEGESLPEQVLSFPPSRKPTQPPSGSKPLRVQFESVEVSEKGLPTFVFQPTERFDRDFDGNWQTLSPAEDDLWRADIRDSAFKKNERSIRKLTARIARGTGYAIWFAVFMVLLEGVLFLGGLWLDSQSAKISAQAPEVRRIEDKQSLMNKLDQVAQNELRPIAILRALNKVRPEGIYFTSTVIEGRNQIVIDGIANKINELNEYSEALRTTAGFESVGDQDTKYSEGKITFRTTFDYIHRLNSAPTDNNKGKEE